MNRRGAATGIVLILIVAGGILLAQANRQHQATGAAQPPGAFCKTPTECKNLDHDPSQVGELDSMCKVCGDTGHGTKCEYDGRVGCSYPPCSRDPKDWPMKGDWPTSALTCAGCRALCPQTHRPPGK